MESGALTPILPALAYAERLRQIRSAERDEAAWRRALDLSGVTVEAFSADVAERLAPASHQPAAWRAHARDFLIAAHIHGEREVVTSDRGPAWDGVARLSPAEATTIVRALLGEGNALADGSTEG